MTMKNPNKTKCSLFSRLCSEEVLYKAWEFVKAKRSAGGIDGESIVTFEAGIAGRIKEISLELSSGLWKPQPYLKVEIPKNKTEKRRLGLLTVKDKIVQQALRLLIEPRLEKGFYEQSYGYRPNKGGVPAIKQVLKIVRKNPDAWIVRLDIDNFFDNIDHTILESRLSAITVGDHEIRRLIMLCVKMGAVTKKMKWQDTTIGLPQGAVLSPCLANLYMHSFDQFVVSRTTDYVRYADDFVIILKDKASADLMLQSAEAYLRTKLKLSLNPASVTKVSDGFEFLGISFQNCTLRLSENKKQSILEHIRGFSLDYSGLSRNSIKRWNGIENYYGRLLPQSELAVLDNALYSVLKSNIESNFKSFANKNIVEASLTEIHFLTKDFKEHETALKQELISFYLELKRQTSPESEMRLANRKIIHERKREYQKQETENSEIILNSPGTAVGLAKNRLTIKQNGILKHAIPTANIKHITVLADGVSVSSNLLKYLIGNKIPIDFYAQLNPFDSIIHVRQNGKTTFVYDVMEIFRAQAVDRVVFSLIQKKEPVEVKNGMLTDTSKALLVKNITERFQKREKYRGEEISFDKILKRQASEIAEYFREGRRFLPYKAKW